MKCNPWRWLWGLIPILMLGWIAILGERSRIEADLAQRTKVVLDRSGYGWAAVTFEGRDATLTGRAVEEAEAPKAVAAVLDTMGVRTVENKAQLIDKVDRYEWSAIRRDNKIRVDGLVPSDKTRRDVLGMVKANFPSLEIDDRMKLARGAPPLDVWLGGVGFGLNQLVQLREGRVDLEQTSLSVRGDATDARGYRVVKSALAGQLPQGISLKSEAVRPPVASPFAWSARRQGKEILLTGHVPNDTVRDDLMRAARRIAADIKVVDRTEPASGAPDGFAAAAAALVEQLGQLEDGSGQIRDKSVTLNGIAETAARADAIKAAMRTGPLGGFRAGGEIKHREPPVRTISPYATAADLRPDAIVLSGYVPDEKARAAVTGLARQRFAARAVRDEMQLGAGQPPGWEQCLEVALDALQRLGNGRAGIVGRRLEISGKTDVEPLAQALPGEVRGKAGSSCDADVRITLDVNAIAARDEARRKAEAETRQATQEGGISFRPEDRVAAERARADEARRAQEQAEAERRQADETRRLQTEAERRRAEELARLKAEEERQRVALGEQERQRSEAARLQAEAERRRAEEERQRVALAEERRRSEAARQADAARQAAAASETRARQQQAVVDECQQALSRVAREGVINFKRASFDLDPASFATLNRLAEAVNRCATVVVEIEGHTDSEGTPERNQRLSDRRANSVRDYLSKAGVDAGRLIAVGYGQDRAIAPNDTPEGRAKNRRIEFTVKLR